MPLPSPAYREYVETVATVLVVSAVVQYLGVGGPSGEVDLSTLLSVSVGFPILTYLISVAGENIASFPRYDRMVRDDD